MPWPVYSSSTWPAAMSCTAKTPLPCTPERRVWMRRPVLVLGAMAAGALGGTWRGMAKNCVNWGMHACARVCARIRIVKAPGPCPDAQYDWRENHPHDQDPGNCRKAFGGAGHRARTDPRGGQVRQA